ncbi:MAG: ABC transporter ATP-binding protein [Burkholderiaceae bacterium]|nr:ABC transporter ATP-binding protein [Burkholderiaceae bacterium]
MTALAPTPSPTVTVSHLGKEYKLYASPRQRLKALLTGRPTHRSHWALRDVSFSLPRGACLGVVGNNGAGKSSLLKLLAGTMQPSTGSVQRSGRVTAILELGAGFHPDFTGRQNLYFGGSLIGISAEQMAQLEPEIIAFSELGDALDRPVKTYSSGMAVRLAFALVTAIEPDLLIIDEALAVGDQHFQKKCVERIDAFRRNGCTILFCSHSLYHVRQLCDVVLWLDQGQQRAFGETESVLASYEAHVRAQDLADKHTALAAAPSPANAEPRTDETGAGTLAEAAEPPAAPPLPASTLAGIVSVELADLEAGAPEQAPLLGAKDLVITVTAQGLGEECPHVGIMLEQAHGPGITTAGTLQDGVAPTPLGAGLWRARLRFTDLPLHSGEYVVSAYLFDRQGLVVYDQWLHCANFRHVDPRSTPGLLRLPHRWE